MKRGAVAAGHPATAAAAGEILKDGGTAFDAVLAALGAACVAEPVLASLGGGGFLLAAGPDIEPRLYDFFVETPLKRRPIEEIEFFPISADFGTTTQEFHIGVGAFATPGMVHGLFQVHADLGRLPMSQILQPAISLAREGVLLRAIEAYIFQVVSPIFTASDDARALYGKGDGLLGEGDRLTQPALAEVLEALASEGHRLFYEGELAALMADYCSSQGGQISREDLSNYRTVRRQPLSHEYGSANILTNPPPSSGGILVAFALDLLRSSGAGFGTFGGAQHLALLARAMKLTDEARFESHLYDAVGEVEEEAAASRLFDPSLLDRYREMIQGRPKARRGTTHISVIDSAGNAAALSLSNGEGCGRLLPGTGIMLNNMLGEEDLNPRGFHSWPEGTRLASMMAPSLAFLADGATAALGSGGSNRIRTAILQVLVNLIEFRLPVMQAVSAPRLHLERAYANLEQGFPDVAVEAVRQEAEDLLVWPEQNLFFGGVHAVSRKKDGRFEAAGDPRRGGVALIA